MNVKRWLMATAMVLLLPTSLAFAWGAAGGDGSDVGQLQELAVFTNNSGGTLTSGTVVVLDLTATVGSTRGAYMTTTSTDSATNVLGVLKSSSVIDGAPGVVITRGPALALHAGATDPTSAAGDVIGAANGVAGQFGNASNLGINMEAIGGRGADYGLLWIWVNPTNGD